MHFLRWSVVVVVLLTAACGPSTTGSATQAPVATAAPAPATQSAGVQPTQAGGVPTQPVLAQATAAVAVATNAAAPAATGVAAVVSTREAEATLAPTQSSASLPTPIARATNAATPAGTAAPAATNAAAAPNAATPGTTAAASSAPPSPATTVTVKGAYAQASSVQGALYIAREKGFFARHGLNVELSQIGGTQQVAAMLSGELQFGALGANEVANADLRGADLVMVATCSDLPIFSLFANKKFTSVPELAGESIGVTTAGSATDAAAHLFLKQYDMLDKVKILPAGGTIPSILAAMGQGTIAAGVLSPPTTAVAEQSGYTELVNGAKLGVPMNHSGIAITRGYLNDHAQDVNNFLAAYQEAWTYVADPANQTDVVAVLGQYTQSDARLAEIGYQAMLPVWTGTKTPRVNPQAVANLLQVSGVPEAASAAPDQFFDNGPINSVAPPS